MTADAALRPADPALLTRLKTALGPIGWVDPADHARYLEEPRGRWRGEAALILRPSSTEEIALAIREAAAARVPITPYGGGTGLVGGQIVTDGPRPLLVSLERMNRIRSLSLEDDVMIVEAGATLQSVREAADAAGRLFPLSYASQGTATIGGALATNAGGVQVLRYGNARDLCLGVEAVLPEGRIYSGLRGLRKDNTGYDLRHLLIGSEGTLGIITAAALKLYPRPAETATAMATLGRVEDAIALLRALQAAAGDSVTAFELMSATGLGFVFDQIDGLRDPFPPEPRSDAGGGAARAPWTALIELSGLGARDRLEHTLGRALETGGAIDAVVAASEAQRAALWRIREDMPLANRAVGAIASHDVSLPISKIPAFVEAARAAIAELDAGVRINCFGHLGDGNLHYNQFPAPGRARADYAALAPRLTRLTHDLVDAFGGSISAEHGIGRLKTADLARYGDPTKLAAMRAIKTALDPSGVMNPGAVLPIEGG